MTAIFATLVLSDSPSRAANSSDVFSTTATNLASGLNYVINTILPLSASTTDVQFSGTYVNPTLTVNGAALNFGTLNDLNTTQNLVITNTSAVAASLTLNTPANSTTGANTSDLLYVKAGGLLTVQAGTGGLALNLLNSGNIHNDGTLNLSSAVNIAALTTATFTGTGATTVSGSIGALLGSVNVATTGGGSVTLSGNNAYIGNTSITSGVLNASSVVVTGGVSSLGNAISAVNLGGTTTTGTLNYTGNSATYTRGFVVNAGGGELDVANANQVLTLNTGNVVTTGAGNFTVGGAGNVAIQGIVGGGTGGLNKTGSGILTLSGANTYSGPTAISGGTVQISASNNLGANTAGNTLALSGGGTLESIANSYSLGANRTVALTGAGGLQVDSGNLRVTGAISGTGTLTKSGSGTLTLSAANTALSGAVQIAGGTLALANAAALNANVGVNLGLGGILDLNGTPAETIANLNGSAGIVTNTSITPATLTLNGSVNASFGGTIADQMCPATVLGLNVALGANATQTLGGSNNFTGLTTVTSGTLQLANANALGNGGIVNSIITGGTTVQAGGTVDLNAQANVNEVLTLNGTGSTGNGALINSNTAATATIGSGVSSINVSGSFTGLNANTTVTIGAPASGGTNATASAVLGVSAGSFNINGGTTVYTTAPTVTIGGGSGATAVANLTLGVVTSITITNPGCGFTSPPTISFSGGTVLLPGTNPTGVGVDGQFVLDGVQVTGNGSGYVTAPTVTVSSGAVVTSANLTAVTLASDTSVGGAGNIGINAVIGGSGGLTKVGAGTVTLNASEVYTGGTSVTGGTLALGVNNALAGSSGVTISSGGTLAVGATSTTVNGNVNLANGSITGSGSLTAGGVNPTFTVSNGSVSASLGGVGATLTKTSDGSGTGGTVVLTGTNIYTGPTQVNAGTLEVDGSISPSSGVTVGGATASGLPVLSGIGTIAGTLTVSAANGGAAGILSPGTAASAIGSLTVGNVNFQGGSTLVMDLSGSSADFLRINQVANIASGTNLQLNAANLTLGSYTLASAASGLNSNPFNIVGGLPSDYVLLQSATSLILQHVAVQSFDDPAPISLNIIAGSSFRVDAVLNNTAPAGSDALEINLADNGGTAGAVGNFFTSDNGAAIPAGGSTVATGTFTATNVGMNETWSFKNTDAPSEPASAVITGPVNVFNHATPTLTITGGNNQSGFVGATLVAPTVALADTTGVLPVPLDVAGLGNLTGVVGSGAVASGGTATYTGTPLNTLTPGIGKTEVLAILTGDEQTVVGANPLTTLTQTITYNVYNHATPTLTLTAGNVPAAFVGGAVGTVTATLSDGGNVPAPLDVGPTLTNLTGATGTNVVPSNGTALYNVTGFDTSVAQLGKTLSVGLTAGDTQTIPGANPLTALTQTVTYNVYNHTAPTLAITSGNDQSVFVGGTPVGATVTLSDNGSAPAPLDVASLTNLIGSTGSGVVTTGGTAVYTATGFDTTVSGIGKTLTTSLSTGDQQTIPGANPLHTLTQSVVYNVFDHSAATTSITAGNNQSVFVGGTLAPATVTLDNTAGANPVPVDVQSLSNLSGATGPGVVGSNTTANYAVTGFNTATAGIGKTVTTSLLAGDLQSVTGANPLSTFTQTLTYNVYNHATSTLTGGTFDLGIMHVGYTAPVTSANSLTATNGAASDDRVNLQGSAPSVGNISVNSLSGIASGASGTITATLATGQGVGAINTPLTYTFGDQSAIAGALSNVGTATLNVTGLVYSGQSAWTGNGTAAGSWGTLVSNFGANWGVNQGSPGLDSGFTSVDTASFGTVAGEAAQTVTLDGTNPSLNSLTFNATATSYNIAQGTGGAIAFNGGAGSASINDFATGGTQTISAPSGLVTNTNIDVAAGDTLTISGTMSGTGGITLTGDGVVVLSGNNTYTGPTVVDPGTLMINGMTAPQGNVIVENGATLGGSGSTGNVTVQGGGHINLQDGAIDTLTVSSLTIGQAGNPSSISFDIGNGSALDRITDNGSLTFTGTGGTVINIGNVSGTPTLSDGLFHLITSTGITGDLTDVTLSQTALDGKTLTLEINGNNLDILIGDLTGATTYSLGATTSDSRIIVNTGTTTVTSTITNSGTGDSLNYTGLSATGGNQSGGTLPQDGGPLAPDTSSSGTRILTAGATTGVITITPTVASATNGTFGGNAILDGTTTATVDVVDNRVVTASAVSLGRVIVGQAVSGTSTLSTTGDDAHFTRVTVGTTGPDANGISATGGNGEIFNSANVTDTRTVGGTFTTAGNVSGNLTLTTTGEGLAGEAPVNVTLSYSADAVNKRVVTVGATTELGELHTGSTVNITTNPFTTTGDHDTTTDVMVAAGDGVADANGLAISGAATTFDGTTSSATRTISGTITNANGGVTSGTFNLAVTTLENGGAGLAGEGAYPSLGVSYSAMVYSGQGVYNAPGDGSWGTIQNPTDWTANGGAPGLDSNFTDTDSATFGNSIGTGTATVTLDGDNPSLTNITFDNTMGGSYTIAPGNPTGGTITLNNDAGTATINNADGNNTISVPIVLASNGGFSSGSGDTLTLDGPISETGGAKTVTISGPGTVDFGGANTYSGGTTIDSGTLMITGAGTLGSTTAPLTLAGGSLDLGGTTQHTGATTFTGGTIRILHGILVANSYTDDAPTGTQTIDSTLAGTGSVTMDGGGTLELNGPNTYTGGTTINSGTVSVGDPNGLGNGDVDVTGGTLEAGGGNHIIKVLGNYRMTGGTLILNVSGSQPGVPGGYDVLQLNGGTADLGGTLVINGAAGFVPPGGTTLTFVQGGTVSGSFSNVTSNLGSQGITQQGPVTFTIVQLPFATLGDESYTANQGAVARAVDAAFENGASSPNFRILLNALNGLTAAGTSPAVLANAFDQLTPMKFAEFTRSTIFNNASFSTQMFDSYMESQRSWRGDFLHPLDPVDASQLTVLDPSMDPGLAQMGSHLLAYSPAPLAHGLLSDTNDLVMGGVDMTTPAVNATDKERAFNIFVMGNVILAQEFSQADLAHADTTTGGVELGIDYLITPHFKVGVMFGFGHTDGTLDNLGSKATLDSYAPGIFASYADKGWYANALASYGFNSYTEDRHVSFGTLSGVAHGAPSGNQVIGNLDGGYDFHSGHWTYGPTAGVQYTHYDVDSFSENGADPIDLQVGRENSDSLRSRVGAHVSYVFHSAKMTFTPHLDISWQHEFLDQSEGINSQFTSVGADGFETRTPEPSRDSALIDAGLSAEINSHISLYLDYIAQAGQSNYFGQSVQVGMKIGF